MTPEGDHAAPGRKIAVCVVASDPALGNRLASLLSGNSRFDIEFGLDDPSQADVILTDRAQPLPRPQIIVGDEHPRGVREADVRGILPPTADQALLCAAIVIVAAGYMISETDAARGLSEEVPHAAGSFDGPDSEINLTPREAEVLGLLVHGASNKMIARELGISLHTAKFHVASVLAKLGARNRSDAVVLGLRRGLILL